MVNLKTRVHLSDIKYIDLFGVTSNVKSCPPCDTKDFAEYGDVNEEASESAAHARKF